MVYVVSQIFRRPIDNILLQNHFHDAHNLADIINQLTEIDVTLVQPEIHTEDPELLSPSLAEVGAAMRRER